MACLSGFLVKSFRSLQQGISHRLLGCPSIMIAVLLEYIVHEDKARCQSQYSLWSGLRSNAPSLLYCIGHTSSGDGIWPGYGYQEVKLPRNRIAGQGASSFCNSVVLWDTSILVFLVAILIPIPTVNSDSFALLYQKHLFWLIFASLFSWLQNGLGLNSVVILICISLKAEDVWYVSFIY